jgi:hypothetical protein
MRMPALFISLAALLAIGSAAGRFEASASGGAEDIRHPRTGTVQQSAIVHSDAALTYRTDSTYSTATAVIPRMYGSATRDSIPGRYRYTYTLVNEPSSANTIAAFALDPVPRPLSVTPPLHWRWMYGYETEDSALYFRAKPDTNPPPAGWDSLTVVRSIYDLAAGASLTFGFVSDRAPSKTMFFAQGYYQDSISSEEPGGRFYLPVSIWNNSVSGPVVGPGTTKAALESPGMKKAPGSHQLKAPTSGPGRLGAVKPPRPIGSPESVLPPCYMPTGIDTAGWLTAHLMSQPVTFRLPPTFGRARGIMFEHGGVAWIDGRRKFEESNGMWGPHSFGAPGQRFPGYSECIDSVAGIRYRLLTTYNGWDSVYVFAALQVDPNPGLRGEYTEALTGESPDSLDQRLFLAIFRTLKPESAPVSSGSRRK